MIKQPWLVQRLLPPFERAAEMRGKLTVDMVFGGAKDLDQDQNDAISDVFRFDYMGSGHFEFGAIPNALSELATNKMLRPYQVDLTANPDGPLIGFYKLKPKTQTVYIITQPDDLDRVVTFIHEEASGRQQQLKVESNFEFAFFQDEISKKANFRANAKGVCGWHDLENNFLFFLDQGMFDRVRERFKIEGDVTTLPPVGGAVAKPSRKKGAEPKAP